MKVVSAKSQYPSVKYANLSILRIMAAFAIIFLHTNNTLINNPEDFYLDEQQFIFFSVCTQLMNWAVPIFLMITGALLLSSDKSKMPEICIKRYVKRILLALFIFGVPFSIMEIFMETKRISIKMFLEAFINVLNGNSWGHLWYLYALIGIYFLIPVFKIFVDNAERSTQRYILVVLFLFNFCIEFLNQISGLHIAFEIPITLYTIFYILIGKYLWDKNSGILSNKYICTGIIISVSIIIVFGNIILYPDSSRYFGYDSPFIAVMAISIFAIFKEIQMKMNENIWKMDRLCFGIYLIHPVFINFVYKFLKITPIHMGKAYPLGVVIFWLGFSVLAAAASIIMSRFRLLKKYVL